MQFSLASLSLLAMAPLAVFALATEVEQVAELTKFSVEPTFPESQGAVAELINENETPVSFNFVNNEDFPVQVVAFGGSFTYKGQDSPYRNLTTSKIGPILLEANGVQTFTTNLKLILPPQDFDLAFSFLCAFEGGMSTFEAESIAITVSDPPISIWDPKFVIAQLILGLTVIGLGYWVANAFVFPYFEDTQKPAKKIVVEAEPQTSGVVPNDKGYDEAWIPQHHLDSGKKTRKTKNN